MVIETIREKDFDSLYIPPYSPDCNPIENVFLVVKNKYRKMSTNHIT